MSTREILALLGEPDLGLHTIKRDLRALRKCPNGTHARSQKRNSQSASWSTSHMEQLYSVLERLVSAFENQEARLRWLEVELERTRSAAHAEIERRNLLDLIIDDTQH